MKHISLSLVFAVCLAVLLVVPIETTADQSKALKVTNSTKRLADLRAQMKAYNLSAYMIRSVDAHNSEYVSLHDKRREFISGLTGSAGVAIVTMTEAAMWTDGRYYEQAVMEMDSNWVLMKASTDGTPKETDWLKKKLKKNDVVGVDPYLISKDVYSQYSKDLIQDGIILRSVLPNLVDLIWANQPPLPTAEVFVLSLEFTGKTWQDKVKDLRATMKSELATAVVLYMLDEIAWLLNLRGSDIPFNPVFFSYVIVTLDDVTLYVNGSKITPAVRKHLNLDNCSSMCVKIQDYSKIRDGVKAVAGKNNATVWIAPSCSHALVMSVNESTLLPKYSPVVLPKAIKNDVEIKGMMNANLKDAVAICQFAQWMEKETQKFPPDVTEQKNMLHAFEARVPKGRKDLTEISASAKLEEFKSKQKDYMGASFNTIIGYGPNAALIHYSPSKSSDRQITTDSTLLIDTGSQYKDGTCDTTRTFHFGDPTHEQKVAYTRVLKGLIQMGTVTWPNHVQGRYLEILARKELWAGGLDYRHGTGHGIGMFLNVHEGPQAITMGCPSESEKPIIPGMFTSDEPGYYKTGQFGIRLETVLLAVPAKVKSDFPDRYYVTFEQANLTPYERKMIIVDMLTKKELDYVNNHHKMSREKVGAKMKEQNLMDTYDWLVERTKPLGTSPPASGAFANIASLILVISSLLAYFMR